MHVRQHQGKDMWDHVFKWKLVHYTCEVYDHPVTSSYRVIQHMYLFHILVWGIQVEGPGQSEHSLNNSGLLKYKCTHTFPFLSRRSCSWNENNMPNYEIRITVSGSPTLEQTLETERQTTQTLPDAHSALWFLQAKFLIFFGFVDLFIIGPSNLASWG